MVCHSQHNTIVSMISLTNQNLEKWCFVVSLLRKPKKDLHLLAIEPNVNVKLEIYIYIYILNCVTYIQKIALI
jgi:hypothetical protein